MKRGRRFDRTRTTPLVSPSMFAGAAEHSLGLLSASLTRFERGRRLRGKVWMYTACRPYSSGRTRVLSYCGPKLLVVQTRRSRVCDSRQCAAKHDSWYRFRPSAEMWLRLSPCSCCVTAFLTMRLRLRAGARARVCMRAPILFWRL